MSLSSESLYRQLLIIDDDPEDQEIFMEAVKEIDASIQCHTCNNGEDALTELENGPTAPDLIFLDLNMPRLNGKQVLKEIKNRKSLQTLPIIMYSTSFAPRDIDEINKLGAVFHLLKPSKFGDLCKALKDILHRNWTQQGQATN
jgi:CheY-like chemotaxis protein